MKKRTAIVATLLCLSCGLPAPAFAADPCNVVRCMYSKATGDGESEGCHNAEKAFFRINAFKKHRRFSPEKTANLRKAFLSECKTADPAALARIIRQFGRARG